MLNFSDLRNRLKRAIKRKEETRKSQSQHPLEYPTVGLDGTPLPPLESIQLPSYQERQLELINDFKNKDNVTISAEVLISYDKFFQDRFIYDMYKSNDIELIQAVQSHPNPILQAILKDFFKGINSNKAKQQQFLTDTQHHAPGVIDVNLGAPVPKSPVTEKKQKSKVSIPKPNFGRLKKIFKKNQNEPRYDFSEVPLTSRQSEVDVGKRSSTQIGGSMPPPDRYSSGIPVYNVEVDESIISKRKGLRDLLPERVQQKIERAKLTSAQKKDIVWRDLIDTLGKIDKQLIKNYSLQQLPKKEMQNVIAGIKAVLSAIDSNKSSNKINSAISNSLSNPKLTEEQQYELAMMMEGILKSSPNLAFDVRRDILASLEYFKTELSFIKARAFDDAIRKPENIEMRQKLMEGVGGTAFTAAFPQTTKELVGALQSVFVSLDKKDLTSINHAINGLLYAPEFTAQQKMVISGIIYNMVKHSQLQEPEKNQLMAQVFNTYLFEALTSGDKELLASINSNVKQDVLDNFGLFLANNPMLYQEFQKKVTGLSEEESYFEHLPVNIQNMLLSKIMDDLPLPSDEHKTEETPTLDSLLADIAQMNSSTPMSESIEKELFNAIKSGENLSHILALTPPEELRKMIRKALDSNDDELIQAIQNNPVLSEASLQSHPTPSSAMEDLEQLMRDLAVPIQSQGNDEKHQDSSDLELEQWLANLESRNYEILEEKKTIIAPLIIEDPSTRMEIISKLNQFLQSNFPTVDTRDLYHQLETAMILIAENAPASDIKQAIGLIGGLTTSVQDSDKAAQFIKNYVDSSTHTEKADIKLYIEQQMSQTISDQITSDFKSNPIEAAKLLLDQGKFFIEDYFYAMYKSTDKTLIDIVQKNPKLEEPLRDFFKTVRKTDSLKNQFMEETKHNGDVINFKLGAPRSLPEVPSKRVEPVSPAAKAAIDGSPTLNMQASQNLASSKKTQQNPDSDRSPPPSTPRRSSKSGFQ